MDIQSPLLQPCSDYTENIPIVSCFFMHKGQNTNVCLFTDCLRIENIEFTQTILFTLSLKFDIIQQQDETYIKIWLKDNLSLQFRRQNWSEEQRQNWQKQLMRVMNRKNFHQFFVPSKKLGVGNFASVYQATRIKDQLEVAVKAFKKEETFKNPKGEQALFNEITILRSITSPNIAQLYGVYQTDKSIYMVQQYAEGKHLARYLSKFGNLSLKNRKDILKGILNGLFEIHRNNIVHRDIKPQNIIYDGKGPQSLKIVDFGLATYTHQSSYLFVRCGTPGFVAPQIIAIQDNQQVKLNTISDIFSVGAIFYQLIFNKPLFDGNNHLEILQKNRLCDLNAALTQQMRSLVSKQECDILLKMLAIDPKKRITASEGLNHPFLKNQNVLNFKNSLSIDYKLQGSSNTLSKISMYHSRQSAKLKESTKK